MYGERRSINVRRDAAKMYEAVRARENELHWGAITWRPP